MRFLLSTAVVLAAAAGVAAHAAGHPAARGAGRLELIATLKHPVTVTSVPVTGLYPGAARTLTVRVKNPDTWKIKVPSLRATRRPRPRAPVAQASGRTWC
jgi:hypothetical protein